MRRRVCLRCRFRTCDSVAVTIIGFWRCNSDVIKHYLNRFDGQCPPSFHKTTDLWKSGAPNEKRRLTPQDLGIGLSPFFFLAAVNGSEKLRQQTKPLLASSFLYLGSVRRVLLNVFCRVRHKRVVATCRAEVVHHAIMFRSCSCSFRIDRHAAHRVFDHFVFLHNFRR